MPILNYTTTIGAEQTISEIQKMLSEHGVNAMMTEYDGKNVSAVSFRMSVAGQQISYKMPCNWRKVREVFNQQGVTKAKIEHKDKDLDNQAIRTAWRVLLVWIKAQLALVEINMVTIPQIFLPFTIMRNGMTLAETIDENPKFLLGDGK